MSDFFAHNSRSEGLAEKPSSKLTDLLPVTNCRKEFNPLTGKQEFIAPAGSEFEITGDLLARNLGGAFKLRNPNGDLFDGYIASGGLHTARVLRNEEEGVGKRLGVFSGPRLWIEAAGEYGPLIYIGAPVRAQSLPGTKDFSYEIASGSGIYQNTSYEVAHDEILWDFNEAVGFLVDTQVHQRPSTSQQGELVVMRDSDWSYADSVWRPDHAPDTDFYKDFWIRQGCDPDEAERIAQGQLLRARIKGIPLADDPLKHLVLVKEGEGSFIDLDAEVEKIQIVKNEPRSRAEREALSKHRSRQRYLQVHADRLRGLLVVITGNSSLAKAVNKHAHPGWLERELTEYEKTFDLEF